MILRLIYKRQVWEYEEADMEDIALSQMLTEVIELYGKNEGYAIPTISW